MNKFIILGLLLSVAICTEQIDHSNEGPAKIILDYLDDIVDTVEAEQLAHDTLNTDQMKECAEEKLFRANEIIDGEDALSRSTAHKLRCEGSLAEAESDLATVKQYIQEIEANLKELLTRRTDQAAAHLNLVTNELTPAIEAVKGAFPIIDKFENSGAKAFVEISRNMMGTFLQVSKAGHGGLMAGALTALAQSGSQQAFDAATIQTIRTLFENLLGDLKTALKDANELEAKRITVYKGTVAEFTTIQDGLEKQETSLDAYIKSMKSCITTETHIIAAATEKVKNNSAALAYAIRMCDAFSKEYAEATKARNAEIALLKKLKEFINKEAAIFGAYGVENSDVFQSYAKESGTTVDSKAIESAIKAAESQEVKTYLLQVREMGLARSNASKSFNKLSFLQDSPMEERSAPKVSFVQGKLMRN